MSCVPGFFARAGGAGGGATDERALSIALSTACWNAPRCESALLTASGDTCEGSFGGGVFDGDLAVALATSEPCTFGAAATSPDPDPGVEGDGDRTADASWRAAATEDGEAVAANGSGLLGDAVAANGLTGAFGSNVLLGEATMFTLDDGLTGAAPAPPLSVLGPRSTGGWAAGAPQAAQNFADPISSAPHFAQFAMAGLPCWVTSPDRTRPRIPRSRIPLFGPFSRAHFPDQRGLRLPPRDGFDSWTAGAPTMRRFACSSFFGAVRSARLT